MNRKVLIPIIVVLAIILVAGLVLCVVMSKPHDQPVQTETEGAIVVTEDTVPNGEVSDSNSEDVPATENVTEAGSMTETENMTDTGESQETIFVVPDICRECSCRWAI